MSRFSLRHDKAISDMIVCMDFGSLVYGTSTPESDRDVKGVFVPAAEDILLQKAPKSLSFSTKANRKDRNTADDVDEEYFSISEYLKLLSEGQTIAVDMLFVPDQHILHLSKKYGDIWKGLQEQAQEFIPLSARAFVGYCRTQANRYGIKGSRVAAVRDVVGVLAKLPPKDRLTQHLTVLQETLKDKEHISFVEIHGANGVLLPHLNVCEKLAPISAFVDFAHDIYSKTLEQYGSRALKAEKNEGVDWKAVGHAVRVLYEAQELLTTGRVTFPRPEKEYLLAIRTGRVPYEDVVNVLDEGLASIDDLVAKGAGILRGPNKNQADKIVLALHRDTVRESLTNNRPLPLFNTQGREHIAR